MSTKKLVVENSVHVPLISIITITLNDQDGLVKTINSVKNQTITEVFEHIVIDGISNYDARSLVEKLNHSVIFYQDSDAGIYDAMNKGLDYASGCYILFLNSGDEFSTNFVVANISTALKNYNPDFLYGDSLELSGSVFLLKKARSYKLAWLNMFTHHQAMLYKKEIVYDLRYSLAYPQAADYDFTLRFLSRVNKVYYMPEPICIFERGGVSGKNLRQSIKDLYNIRKITMGLNPTLSILVLMPGLIMFLIRRMMPRLYDAIKFSKF